MAAPNGHESAENLRQVVADWAAAHENDCVRQGPIAEVWRAIHELREDGKVMSTEMAENRGAAKSQARNITLIVSIASAVGVLANVVSLILRARHG